MIALKGTGVSPGIVTETALYYDTQSLAIPHYTVEDTKKELDRIRVATKTAQDEIQVLMKSANDEGQMLLDTHLLMLRDIDFTDRIADLIINARHNAETAVEIAAYETAKTFSIMDDEYMREREADILDISKRLISILMGKENTGITLTRPAIIIAEDLSPSETIRLDPKLVRGFILKRGNRTSHTAILARTLGIPAIVNITGDITPDSNGHTITMDGSVGYIVIDPDQATMDYMNKKRAEEQALADTLNELRGKSDVTLDGKSIRVYSNIAHPDDIKMVLDNDARGIGLFRSEFLYLNSSDYPTEEMQFESYRKVVEAMAGAPVIIRTMDIGADKRIDYFKLQEEENPSLGLRGLRISLTRPEIFKTQLRALYRASAYGKLAIMLPMVSSLWEVQETKKLMSVVRKELLCEGYDFDTEIELGVMIETPASVMIAEELAKEVDFFSIGTNDLTQYTTAIDRGGVSELERFYDAHHPAVMKMIKMTIDAAHRHGIWAGICGEIAADFSLTESFLKMGVDELSVSPNCILRIRNAVRHTDLST